MDKEQAIRSFIVLLSVLFMSCQPDKTALPDDYYLKHRILEVREDSINKVAQKFVDTAEHLKSKGDNYGAFAYYQKAFAVHDAEISFLLHQPKNKN